MYRVLALSGLLLALAMPPAFAATTQADVVAACSSASSTVSACKTAIANYISESGKTGADLDKLLGELAYKLVTSGNLTAATGTIVSEALKEIAASATSPELKATITTIANDAADGAVQSLPPNPPSATNPSGT